MIEYYDCQLYLNFRETILNFVIDNAIICLS